MRGAAASLFIPDTGLEISTHAPHARRGPRFFGNFLQRVDFYSRASCEARQAQIAAQLTGIVFLLTRLMRGAARDRKSGV